MYYKVRFSIGQAVFLPDYIFYGVICNFSTNFWTTICLLYWTKIADNDHPSRPWSPQNPGEKSDPRRGQRRRLQRVGKAACCNHTQVLVNGHLSLTSSLSSLSLHHHWLLQPRKFTYTLSCGITKVEVQMKDKMVVPLFSESLQSIFNFVDFVYLFFWVLPNKSDKPDSDSTFNSLLKAILNSSESSYASSNHLLEQMHSRISCTCEAFLHCELSNVFSNWLDEKRHSHIGCTWNISLRHEFSNASSNCVLQ